MIKKEAYLFIGLIFLMLTIPLASAGIFSDLWGKITGKATFGSPDLNITIGNNLPTIGFVESIDNIGPIDDAIRSITFNFTATDADGAADLNPATAEANFSRTGETTRVNTSCIELTTSGNDANYSCTIDMYYFDQNGAWSINVTIQDDQGENVINSSTTFTYTVLAGMKINQTSLTWPSVAGGQNDVGSNNDPIQINNTGNQEPNDINVTGFNLIGETTPADLILVGNITVENASEGCTGTVMQNATSLNITSSILFRGNHSVNYNNATSGQELIYFCVDVPLGISQQSYSSSAYGSWTIEII